MTEAVQLHLLPGMITLKSRILFPNRSRRYDTLSLDTPASTVTFKPATVHDAGSVHRQVALKLHAGTRN